MNYPKHVLSTVSYDGKNGLLYNTYADYLVKYSLNDFPNSKSLIDNEEVYCFLKHKKFFDEVDESDFEVMHNDLFKMKNTLSLIIKVTAECNFRCKYCYERFSKTKIDKEKESVILKFILSEISDRNIKHINISWFGGEPLLNIESIVSFMNSLGRICSSKKIKLSSSITTNGYLLNEKNIKCLLSNNVNLFQITIDGDSSFHDKNRVLWNGEKTFYKIFENLNNISKIKSDFRVIIRTNFTKEMLGNMDGYYKKISKLCLDERYTALFHTVVNFGNMSHEVTDMDILREVKRALSFGVKTAPVTEYLKAQANICYAIQENNYVIDSNLNLSKCTVCNNSFSSIGFLKENGELCKSENFNLWMGARISSKCINCESYNICVGGFCPLFYLKKSEGRCMKFKEDYKKKEIIKVADLQEAYDVYIHR